jgi:hypothetical protein
MTSAERERFLKYAEVRTRRQCWPWQASRTGTGYGRFYLRGKIVQAHRAAYEQWRGPIPEGWLVHHRCKNPGCVNPYHLAAVTRREHAYLDVPPKQRITPRGTST